MPRRTLRPDYSISRLILGGWQFSPGHHPDGYDLDEVLETLVEVADLGVTTFDCADIYEGVEELYGRFLARWKTTSAHRPIQIHTKFVPDLQALATLTKADVARVVDRSLRRLGVDRLDLVQFFWWDAQTPGFEQTGVWLDELRSAGKIRHLAVTNLSVERCRRLRDAGVELVSDQVQYSVLDRRPERTLVPYAQEEKMALLCYGGLAGGFLTDRWLGKPEPEGLRLNRSLVKYRLIIDELGGWEGHQRLLSTLRGIADEQGVDIAAVAVRFVLDQPGVAAVITGASSVRQVASTMKAFEVELTDADRARISEAVGGGYGPPGDVYDLEGDRTGRHGRIMKYGLQSGEAATAPRAR
ncbi:MAG: aldo/keto reductase [Gemmatimonadetes bacterium]|nr:aldo/keto reductase [Gemmatimonadota bacterium]